MPHTVRIPDELWLRLEAATVHHANAEGKPLTVAAYMRRLIERGLQGPTSTAPDGSPPLGPQVGRTISWAELRRERKEQP